MACVHQKSTAQQVLPKSILEPCSSLMDVMDVATVEHLHTSQEERREICYAPMLQKASNVGACEGSVLKSNGHRFGFSHHYFHKMPLSFQAKPAPLEIPLLLRDYSTRRAANKVLWWSVCTVKDLFPVLPVKLLPVKSILLQNETTDTLQARWSPVRGATGYRLTWTSAGRSMGMGYRHWWSGR